MGGEPAEFIVVTAKEQLPHVLAHIQPEYSLWILGAGSNTVFTDEMLHRTVVKMHILGVEELSSHNPELVRYKVSAGEEWDAFVARTTKKGLYGLELLSGIPGTVGAAPMQNIGAYGAEVEHVVAHVECYDMQTQQFCELPGSACGFSYRSSIFKTTARGRYIITAVVFQLSTKPLETTMHAEVVAELAEHAPTPEAVRAAVLAIRGRKLVNYHEVSNVGSFFQNPIITAEKTEELKQRFPTIPLFPQADGVYKTSAAWLLQTAGFKGKTFGHFQFSPQHALVLTHLGGGSMKELLELIAHVTTSIEAQFGIGLQVEPELVM